MTVCGNEVHIRPCEKCSEIDCKQTLNISEREMIVGEREREREREREEGGREGGREREGEKGRERERERERERV